MEKQVESLRTGRSILDAVADRAAALQKQLGSVDRERLDQYFTSVREVERRLAAFFKRLQASQEGDATLLDRTQILYGSNLGNGNNHDNKNLPVILAGGGYKHGQHLAFDKTNNYPLSNLYVSMLQRLGLETAKFSSSTGTMRGLELA